ncbi:hypothetical protein B0A52_09856 [Exophiala mesophila]|uniref:Sugar phosphate transporter domain-containing protein n=1 Tax=Exophiala mesophila TaxID=212818 RepID=A0A438MRV7_EXOME|nr:hypothetical protein B0A52_09856 [Exophiala mesophila]
MEKTIQVLPKTGPILNKEPVLESTERGSLDASAARWVAINATATVAIVYVNKAVFSTPAFRQCQLGFVSFHFVITWTTLQLASRPGIALFTPVRTSLMGVLPLTIAMAANVVLMNLSLAYSSVIFYQIIRILLTPLTALMNLFIYGSRIPFLATLALVPACVGVAVVSYVETVARSASSGSSTSLPGVVFALSGVTVSALYTVWVSAYYRKLKMSSAQLLHNQMPIGGLMLAISSYFMDKYPVWAEVDRKQWMMIAASGICAMLINVSQFYIITHAGPVSSTVVGHLKTVLIIGIGWIVKCEAVGLESALGIGLAVVGIIGYSYALHLDQGRGAGLKLQSGLHTTPQLAHSHLRV